MHLYVLKNFSLVTGLEAAIDGPWGTSVLPDLASGSQKVTAGLVDNEGFPQPKVEKTVFQGFGDESISSGWRYYFLSCDKPSRI